MSMTRRSITFGEKIENMIEDYRRGKSPIPSFNKAVNDILANALTKRKLNENGLRGN